MINIDLLSPVTKHLHSISYKVQSARSASLSWGLAAVAENSLATAGDE